MSTSISMSAAGTSTGPSPFRSLEIDTGADHLGVLDGHRQLAARRLRGQMADLGEVLAEKRRIVGIHRRQCCSWGDAHAAQRQPFTDPEPAGGDRGRGVVRAHQLRAPLLVRALAALVLPDRFHQRARVSAGTRDAAGVLGDLHPEGVFVVVALQYRPPRLSSAAGEGFGQRLVQVVPDEHQPRMAGGRQGDLAGAQHRAKQHVRPGMMTTCLQHARVVGQLYAVLAKAVGCRRRPAGNLAPCPALPAQT